MLIGSLDGLTGRVGLNLHHIAMLDMHLTGLTRCCSYLAYPRLPILPKLPCKEACLEKGGEKEGGGVH